MWAHWRNQRHGNAENGNYTFTVTLTDAQKERLQDGTLNNYIHYDSSDDLTAATNAHTDDLTAKPDAVAAYAAVENGAKIVAHSDADGIFNITFTAPIAEPDETSLDSAAITANDAIRTVVD